MSLLGKIWNRLRGTQLGKKRARRLFFEPLEGRQLLAADFFVLKEQVNPAPGNPVLAGQTITYKITLTNNGPDAAPVTLSDTTPNNTVYESLSEDGGLGFTITPPAGPGDAATATLASMDPGTTTFTYVVKTNSSAPAGTFISNTATADSPDEFDPQNNSSSVDTQVAVQADFRITKVDNPDVSVDAGNNIVYTITLINDGPSDAAGGAILTDAIPINTTEVGFVAPAGWVRLQDQHIFGQSFVAGATAVFQLTVNVNANTPNATVITNTASSSGAINDPTQNNAATATTTVIAPVLDADLSITKTDTPASTTSIPGSPITYTIVVSNAGPTAVTGAKVTDTFPAELTDVSYTSVGDGGAQGNPLPRTGNIDDTVDLPVGGSITYTVTANIAPDATGTLTNTANVAVPNGTNDPGPGPNSAVDSNTLTPTANLAITKTDGVTEAVPGGSVTYTITVSNPGPSTVTGATVADSFDAKFTSLTLNSVAPQGGATSPLTPGPISSLFSDTINLPPNSSITYSITGNIDPAATGSLPNSATVASPQGVTDPTNNNTATDTDTLQPTANLSITKDDGGATSVNAGDTVQYTIVVNNPGLSTVTGATISDTFSNKFSSLNLISVNVTGGATTPKTPGTFTSPFNDTVTMPPNSTITYTIDATVSLGATGTVDNTATVTAPANFNDPVQTNNTSSDSFQIVAAPIPDLVVTKTDSPDINVLAGNELTYTINVANNGGSLASNVSVFDAVPAGTTFVSIAQGPGQTGWTTSTPTAGNQNLVARKPAGMQPNETASFTMIVRVNSSTASGTVITNSANATVTGGIAEANTGNNLGTATTTVQTQANLGVTKSDSVDPVVVGSQLTYTIVVTRSGPSDAQGVTLTDALPAGTTFVSLTKPNDWTTTTVPPEGSGGTVVFTKNASYVAGAGSATFTIVVLVGPGFTDGQVISNTAVVASSTPEPAPDTTSNSDTETTTVIVAQDFGDAPDTYGTLLPNGARHIISNGLRMGANVDDETNGQASANAQGDDVLESDDEDGVILAAQLLAGRDAVVIVNSSGIGRLDAWIDFDKSGVFDADERIATGAVMVAGANPVPFVVPGDASLGGTFARFRLSTAGVAGPTGSAPDGEVEDYSVAIAPVTPGTVGIVPNPEAPGENMLSINGTARADSVTVTQLRTHLLRVQVSMNGKTYGPFNMSNFRQIVAYAGAGGDNVQVNVGRPSTLRGEAGNDRLTGGSGYDSIFGGPNNDILNGTGGDDVMYGGDGDDTMNGGDGNDVLLGEGGNDTLNGGKNRDLLIGGLGVDRLNGEAGDDILIGGTTAHDNNRVALNQIMAIWISQRDPFPTRLTKLAPFINNGTVVDDASRDRLDGGTASTERDWYVDYLMADASVNFSTTQDRKN